MFSPSLEYRAFLRNPVCICINDSMHMFPASVQTIIISRFMLNLRRSAQKSRTVPSKPSRVRTLPIGSLMNDMGDPLDHGFNELEQLREDPPDGEMEAGPSGTRRADDDANAHFSFDAM